MIKLTNLLKEEETFTATSKKSGETSVFKSKDSRDAAVKSGTHSKVDDKEDDKEDDKSKGDKPNMFSKDSGYDDGDKSKSEPTKSEPTKSEPTKLKYSKDGKMTQDSADSINKELNAELGVDGMTDINLDTGTIEYFISDDSEEAIFIGKEEGGKGVAVSFGDGGDEYKTFKNSKDAVAYAKELGNQLKGGEAKEEPKSEPTKLKYSKDGKMTQDSADSINKELNAELGVDGMTDINLDTGTIEYFISDDSEEAIFIGKEEGGKGVAVSFGDGGDEYKTFKNSKDAVAYAKELAQKLKGGESKDESLSEGNSYQNRFKNLANIK